MRFGALFGCVVAIGGGGALQEFKLEARITGGVRGVPRLGFWNDMNGLTNTFSTTV